MDLLNVLRVMRQNTVKLWCIMTKPQRLIAERLAERVLSEYSTNSEAGIVQDDAFNSNGDGKYENKDDFGYLDLLLKDRSIQNMRLFDFYNQMDQKRTLKWQSMNPKLAAEQSSKMLKHLIANNMTRPRVNH